MAIFNNSNSTPESPNTDSNTTIITHGAKIKGELNLSCKLYMDGEFEGTIFSEKEINIGKRGHVVGDIVAKRLVIQGLVQGSINGDIVEIRSEGRVNGSIESSELIIESKGIFEGTSILKKNKTTNTPKENGSSKTKPIKDS